MLATVKITVDLDDELYRAVKVEAARSDRSVRGLIAEAIEGWLQHQEDEEDCVRQKLRSRNTAAMAASRRRRCTGTWPRRPRPGMAERAVPRTREAG